MNISSLELENEKSSVMSRPLGVIVLIVLELFIGILGIASGLNLLADPSGRSLGLDSIID